MITCPCPAEASLPDIPCVKCPERFGQIQKVAFQRLRDDNGSPNSFPKSGGVDSITDLASWQSAMTAADSAKIVISPYIYSPTQESGAPRIFGGGNDSLNGVEEILGREVSTFTASLRNCPQTVVKLVKKMQCEGAFGIYLFDQYGNIECLVDADGNAYPIPIKSFFIGDKVHGGIDAPDTNVIQWAFVTNYSDDLKIFVPMFNPLSDLCISESPAPPADAHIKNVEIFHSLISNNATSISFLKGTGGAVLSEYERIGFLDDEQNISVWKDENDRYIVMNGGVIYAPESCESLFYEYENLTSINFDNFNTDFVTNMLSMFEDCGALLSLDLHSFNTSSVTSMALMFKNCVNLAGTLNLRNFDTSSVMDMSYMFDYCLSLQYLYLSDKFTVDNVTNAFFMFRNCSSLEQIESYDWNFQNTQNSVFIDCNSLHGALGTTFSASHTNSEYARIDKPGRPGYFTEPD